MLPKKNHLPREEFRKRGYRVVSTPYFSVKTKNNLFVVNRIGVVVGLSVSKRAVQRNFLERQAKKQFLQVPASGKDFIVTIFPKVSTLSKKQFIEELEKAMRRI